MQAQHAADLQKLREAADAKLTAAAAERERERERDRRFEGIAAKQAREQVRLMRTDDP